MIEAVQTRFTAAEYFQMPETVLPTELLNGEYLEMPAPSLSHQDMVLNVAVFFRQILKILGGKVWIAPTDVYFDEINVTQPDVIWLADTNDHCVIFEGKHLRGAPDLIVEVLSPGTMLIDKRDKFRLYEKYGVREYWLLHPIEHFVEIYQSQDEKFVFACVFGAQDTFEGSILAQAIPMTLIFGDETPQESSSE